jgi:hypothetical protein
MMKSIIVIGAVVLLTAPVAMAKPWSIGVCRADIKAKCPEAKVGGGRIKECVKTHAAEFSDPCKARLARVAAISNACATDIKQNCAGKERSCILKSIGNLNDQCKDALGQAVGGKK